MRWLVRLRLEAGAALPALVDVLAAELPRRAGRGVSRAQARSLVMRGAARVNGRVETRPGSRVPAGAQVEVRLSPGSLPARDESAARIDGRRILFEDEHLIAVDKPAGLPTHPTADPARASLVGLLEAFLGERDGRRVRLGVHQRLDRDTSGVLLFAKTAAANAGLAAAFASGAVGKTYLALVGRPPVLPAREWAERRPLGVKGGGRRARMGVVESGGARAETGFRVLEVLPRALLLEAVPVTGRKHQVRAHLAAAGLPILGDRRYGGPEWLGGRRVARAMLHAARLVLPHPVGGRRLAIECPPPSDFSRLLRLSGAGPGPKAPGVGAQGREPASSGRQRPASRKVQTRPAGRPSMR